MSRHFLFLLSLAIGLNVYSQKPEDTEVYSPVPKHVNPGKPNCSAPSDAVVLFDGKDLNQWVSAADRNKAAGWEIVQDRLRVNKDAGDIETKEKFLDYQLHLEWRVPENVSGKGQARGNSGIFLAAVQDGGYEVQILDNYENTTYVNGQAGSVYKQFIPLVNPSRPPGEWNVYDIIWTAPRFNSNGSLQSPARVTVLFNSVLVQNNVALKGRTEYIGEPKYDAHGAAPIRLQAHGDPSEPISFRNIWLRNLQPVD
ncbi:MAG: 3-keto-disaccharide hydrolase [Flavisolibacter sp.]